MECIIWNSTLKIFSRLQKIPMKDFAAEIRAHLDVEQFLSQAQLMLDVQENDLKQILNEMLHHLMDHEESVSAFQEASRALFTDATGQLGFIGLSKSIQCTCSSYGGSYDYDQSWICVLCTAATVQKRHVAIARLRSPANLGRTCQEVWFIIMVVTSTKEAFINIKGTKNALETGRTFATLFADIDLRLRLLGARTEQEFKQVMWEHMKELAEEQCEDNSKRKMSGDSNCKMVDPQVQNSSRMCWIGRGIREDLKRRLPHYLSDFKDGFVGQNTLHKTVSTTFFLYFACILPAIALGVLNYNNTSGKIDVTKAIYSQTIGGLFFALMGGQPMVILLTTAPLALYTKVIYNICQEWGLDFMSMFACIGLWNSFFLLIYAFTDASKLMKWCTRSTEEIFAIFISLAFAFDAFKDVVSDFHENYNSKACLQSSSSSSYYHTLTNDSIITNAIQSALTSSLSSSSSPLSLFSENSLLYLLLMLGTVWLGLSLYNFTKTPFLNASKRELLADCALPVSVILMSFFGSYVFREVNLKKFQVIDKGDLFKLPRDMLNLTMALGFCLSLLFFMDQNTASAIVNSPDNRLKKGPAYHWDLVVIAIINAILSFLGLPMVHGALPHSPLHVRAMADKEDRVYQGRVHLKIVSVRETRVTGILSHILIGLSVHFIDKLQSIPRPVLDGLFLYLAITALHSNQMFERIMLLLTEQAAYPPNHYIRTVPQRKIHLFTFIQLLQLAILCGFGFAPVTYLKMVFPILHLVMLPIRHKVVPHLFERKFLQSLDGH
ncbi:hypothetical protein HELRODRAFT_65855 [Helobdella robusta]|uniref:Bicarbonate transporter-like transmembrane domain-containing protein n=1 Tax=Helobdella robusta TaxID=6412 RepID=T1FYD7_HELRO|nr:hypothetical protein HELRODRAFT_65855 [Helobdella robusta]ESO01913.1 hypothetical protein HELRODRAFT_65855 [Helobdella robusta]